MAVSGGLRSMAGPPEHEKLVAYRRAIELAGALERIAQAVPARRADLADQLRRASASIPLNLAEGAGEFSPSEKARFYRMARRSASECSAALDVLDATVAPRVLGGIGEAKTSLREIGAMLTALIKVVEDRKR